MTSKLEKLLLSADPELILASHQVEFLQNMLFEAYEPCLPPNASFSHRLQTWIENFSPTDSVTMYKFLNKLFFVGQREFEELYRYAYNGPIARWLIDKYCIKLDDPDGARKLSTAAQETWFCPISDSLRINAFFHINKISAFADFRPDWRSLAKFSDLERVQSYISQKGVKNIVLLEDFVGGGSQLSEVQDALLDYSRSLNILICPLIICPEGAKNVSKLSKRIYVDFEPVLILNERAFVFPNQHTNELPEAAEVRKIILKTYPKVSFGSLPEAKPYTAFGFQETGGLVVMYSNTPDNTLPCIHHLSDEWAPLFLRHSRV
ncbi:MAG: hypothetical protein RRB13_08850 [bacterium]|nr:hypothetical protein [bacterium]